MHENQKISIIIPAYNAEATLKETVGGLLSQTYKNLEIIIVDDGSSDKTLELSQSLSKEDERIKVYSKENGGVSSARLKGVSLSTGDWIGFCDADDLLEPEMYEILLKNAINTQAEISHCGYKRITPLNSYYFHNTGKYVEQDNIKGLYDLLSGKVVEPNVNNKLYKRSLFDVILKEDLMDFSIKINEDLLLNYYLFKQSQKSIFVDKCLYLYMEREGSASGTRLRKDRILDAYKVKTIIYNKEGEDSPLRPILEHGIISNLVVISTLHPSKNKENIKPEISQARKALKQFYKKADKKSLSRKVKFKARLAILFPNLYRTIYSLLPKKEFGWK